MGGNENDENGGEGLEKVCRKQASTSKKNTATSSGTKLSSKNFLNEKNHDDVSATKNVGNVMVQTSTTTMNSKETKPEENVARAMITKALSERSILINSVAKSVLEKNDTKTLWILDSGGTEDIVRQNDKSCVRKTTTNGAKVYQADGQALAGCYEAELNEFTTIDGRHSIHWGEAITAPISYNICSLRKRLKQGYKLSEDFDRLYLPGERRRGKNAAHLPIKQMKNGLFGISVVPVLPKHHVLLTALEKKRLEEHRRTGHHSRNKHCKPCRKNKNARRKGHRKQRGPNYEHKTFNDCVSWDLCGPLPVSIQKNRYWAIGVDAATKTTEIIPIRTKDEAVKGLEAWIRWHGAPKSVRSDNGGEFLPGSKFGKLVTKIGASHRYTVARSPQANGMAEAGNKCVMTYTRILLDDAGLGNEYWDFAASAACYTLDRSERTCNNGKSSYEHRKGRPPSVKQLRKFGSRCFWLPASDLKLHQSKVSSRRRPALFLGYDRERPCYVVQDEATKKIYSTADVAFEVEVDDLVVESDCDDDEGDTESDNDIQINVLERQVQGGVQPQNMFSIFGWIYHFLFMVFSLMLTIMRGATDTASVSRTNPSKAEIRSTQLSKNRKMNRREWRFLKRKNKKKIEQLEAQAFSLLTKNDSLYQRYGKRNLPWFTEERLEENHDELVNQRLMREALLNTVRVSTKCAFSDSNPDKPKWQAAVQKEYEAFKKKEVFSTISRSDLLSTDTIIPLVNLYELKDSGTRHKCRCIVLGNRVDDPPESYAPVCNYSTVRLLLNYALNLNLKIMGFDISEAFLFGELEEGDRVIVKPPPEFGLPPDTFWLLKRSLYGLKQAPLAWNRKLDAVLNDLKWTRMSSDGCLYRSPQGNFLICYVDDVLMVGNSNLHEERKQIMDVFPGREINPVIDPKTKNETFNFLGQKIERGKDFIKLSQEDLCEKIISKFENYYDNINPTKSPLNEPLTNTGNLRKDFEVRVLAGSLMHLACSTRPDLAFCTKELSRFLEEPRDSVVDAGKRIIGYLKRTKSQALMYHKIPEFKNDDIVSHLKCYCDSDFATEVPGRKSTTGLVVTLNNTPLIWKSVTQRLVSLSTAEAEFIALTTLVQNMKYLDKIIKDIHKPDTDSVQGSEFQVFINALDPYEVLCDNQAAIKIANTDAHELARTKHMDIRTNFVKENIKNKFMTLSYVNTALNVADYFTKPSAGNKLHTLLGN